MATGDSKQPGQADQLRALAAEMKCAISAIERNDLAAFANHVALQQSICDRLLGAQQAHASVPTFSGRSQDSESIQEMQKARAELAYINKVYAAVLKRAQRTTSMITSIHQAHAPGYGRKSPIAVKHQTWSCEA